MYPYFSLYSALHSSPVRDIDDNAFAGSPNLQIFTSKDSGADKFGQEKGIPVTYQSAYPTDFMDSNANLDVKPNVGTEDNNNQTSTILLIEYFGIVVTPSAIFTCFVFFKFQNAWSRRI